MTSPLPVPAATTALTVVRALRAVVVLAVVADVELVDELAVPLSEIVIDVRALLSVKSASTVLAIDPVLAVAVR
jgi:hypothetical protein